MRSELFSVSSRYFADCFDCTELIEEFRLHKNAIATDAAAKPRGEGLPVGKAASVHRTKFWRRKLHTLTVDTERSLCRQKTDIENWRPETDT
jgi:hypothetical protein